MMILLASVFPLPDSPEMTMHVSFPLRFIVLYAASPMAKMCGGRSKISRPNNGPVTHHSLLYLAPPLLLFTFVLAHVVRAVDVERSVRVHRDAHLADVRVKLAAIEPAIGQ